MSLSEQYILNHYDVAKYSWTCHLPPCAPTILRWSRPPHSVAVLPPVVAVHPPRRVRCPDLTAIQVTLVANEHDHLGDRRHRRRRCGGCGAGGKSSSTSRETG